MVVTPNTFCQMFRKPNAIENCMSTDVKIKMVGRCRTRDDCKDHHTQALKCSMPVRIHHDFETQGTGQGRRYQKSPSSFKKD